jgi:hypothetical protein
LQQHEGQGQVGVYPAMALAATHWILQQQQSFQIPETET